VVYYFPSEETLVGGDLIIGGSVGRTDLPDSSPRQMAESLRKVMTLADATRLLGGHGTPSTLGEERRTNPFLGGGR
jgi:glyoxylase-like metal-dependent hydrolase (beta-lactamase superfamily II)